jgi:hypothetical protein
MKTYIVIVDDYGTKRWYLDDKLHREDGPAVEYTDGRTWYLNGKLHRVDGPAMEYYNGSKYWFLNDKFHRTDGPAIELTSGTKYWFLNGVEYTESDWFKQTQKVKAPCVGKVVEIDGVKYKLVEA